MNKGVIFVLGVATGSVATYFLVKNKYKKIADEEIESVVQTFKKRFDELSQVNQDEDKDKNRVNPEEESKEESKTEKEVYEEAMKDLGYSTFSEDNEEESEDCIAENVKVSVMPYIISEEEFNDPDNNYDNQTLLYYADKILADEDDEKIVDPEMVVGNALAIFDDPLTERVYVRDETGSVDYVILRSERDYTDIVPGEED